MQTALNYWKAKEHDGTDNVHLVWAGLEPTDFRNLFHKWEANELVAELNLKVRH